MEIRSILKHPAVLGVWNDAACIVQNTFQYVRKNKWVILPVAALIFAFYWYEVRPVRIYRLCAVQASIDARNLLRSKSEITVDPAKLKSYQDLMRKDMYLRTDYESFFRKCLRYYAMSNEALLQE